MAVVKTKTKTKGQMKTGLEGLNVLLSRMKLEKPNRPIILNTKWEQFVGQVEFEGHRLQSKRPFARVVRNDLYNQMILVIDDMDKYTGEKKTRGRGTSENSLYN